MRQIFPVLVLCVGAAFFAACSKKADTAPDASSAPVSSTPDIAGTPPAEESSGISFNLSGGSGQPANPSAGGAGAPAADNGNVPPQQLNEIFPFYPFSLRMRAIEGRVDIGILINAEGRVEKAEVVQATEDRFTPFALAAVRTARFVPATEKGLPVASSALIRVPFVSELGSGKLPPDSVLARIAYLDGLYYTKDSTGKMILANTKEPMRLSIITPYPANAKPGETLTARVKLAITEEGQVTSVAVSDASTPEFGTALKEVALFWQFLPQMKNGKALPTAAVAFPFTLKVPGGTEAR